MTHPPKPTAGPLADLWAKPVSELVLVHDLPLAPELQERHRIYSLLVMSLVSAYWNGNKRGQDGMYPGRAKQQLAGGRYVGGDYLGHNIACIAVDGLGAIIDFDFNHNEILASSVEHAESRLVRRLFSLTHIQDAWQTHGPQLDAGYTTLLEHVTVYSSLESCAQCSGIMALGSLHEIVFLQRDPGQNSIGNILRNLTPAGARYQPPLPIPADAFGLPHFARLGDAYDRFVGGLQGQPFFVPSDGGKPDRSPAITSFLCTDAAKEIFDDGHDQLSSMTLQFPDWAPPPPDSATGAPKTNGQVLAHARSFLDYAVRLGRRGTPHKL